METLPQFDTTPITIQAILDSVGADQLTQYGAREIRHYSHCTPCQGYDAIYIAKCLEVIARRNDNPVFIYKR